MKKELKNVRIITDTGDVVLLSQKRYHCLLQTLDLLASGEVRRQSQSTRPVKGHVFRN